MDIDDSAIAIADAMGTSFTELAPPGEERFEPVSMSLIVSYWILHAVAAGIHDGIQESAKDATVTTLDAVGRSIRARLVPARIRKLFDKKASPSEAESRQQAADQVAEARKKIAGLDSQSAAELIGTAASAVTQALAGAGLNSTVAGRVGQTIDVQIRIVIGGVQPA
jgi:hypothetical protein